MYIVAPQIVKARIHSKNMFAMQVYRVYCIDQISFLNLVKKLIFRTSVKEIPSKHMNLGEFLFTYWIQMLSEYSRYRFKFLKRCRYQVSRDSVLKFVSFQSQFYD